MSLFICMECGCIENTNLVSKNIDTNPEYPNLHRIQMDGFNFDTPEIGEVKYLCSECNTGIWHGEFEKREADDIEKEIASYSKSNMTTPADHPEGCITGGYHVGDRYRLFVKLFGKDVGRDNNKLFRIYLEDRMNFNIGCLYYLNDIVDKGFSLTEDDVKNAMSRSQIYSGTNDVKSKTYLREVIGISSYGGKKGGMMLAGLAAMASMNIDEMIDNRLTDKFSKKKHWKELQSESDKDLKVRKAKLKRDIKSLKKQKPVNKDLLEQITKEYKEL